MNAPASPTRWRMSDLLWLLLYGIMVLAIVISLNRARQYALSDFSSTDAQSEWNQWRNDVKDKSDNIGPVERRLPKSTQPPTLLLLRDHFPVVQSGALLMSSVLFVAFMFFCRAIFSSPPHKPHVDD